jgi:hypothetical protein
MSTSSPIAPPKSQSLDSRIQLIAIPFAVFLIAYALFYQCFMERAVYFDEVGLHNPVYTYLHYGKMTYPAHGQFGAMFVHPPVHYLIVATLMRFGLSLFHAAGLVGVVLFAVMALLTVFSRFPLAVKLGLPFGVFLGAFVWNEALSLRPDVTLATSWAAGLVALETARLGGWIKWRLFLGGFLLAFASGVHYPGIAACLGILVYAGWMWRALPRQEAQNRIQWMFGGALLFGIPYVVFFLAPNFRGVLSFSLAIQGAAAAGSAFQHQMEAYAVWRQALPYRAVTQPVSSALTAPLFRLSIPAAFVGPPLLFAFPATRGLALASLPHLLFILFGARHKQIGYSGYFAPEIMIYLAAIVSATIALLLNLVDRLKWPVATAAVVLGITGVLALSAVTDIPALGGQKLTPAKDIYDLDLGRAAGRSMLGPNAVVGTTSAGDWYTSGATHLYFVTPELLYPPDISGLNLQSFFGIFDALAVDPHQTWATYNKQRLNITSAYLDGILQLRGFYYADRRTLSESGISYMLYSVTAPKPLVGYGVRGSHVYRFEEAPGADHVMVCATCPVSVLDNGPYSTIGQLDFYATFYWPQKTNADPRSRPEGDRTPVIRTFVADKGKFETQIRPLLAPCTVRTETIGRLDSIDQAEFLRNFRKSDQSIHFYERLPELREAVKR